jgi:manganese transport protein
VILSAQLPFAIIPLVLFTSDKTKMGMMVSPRWLTSIAWIIAVVIVTLNLKFLWDILLNS